MLSKKALKKMYDRGLSMMEISHQLNVNVRKVNYWMEKFSIKRRTISDAIYVKHNPDGDPFYFKTNLNSYEQFLAGLGIGLFWGEGMKTNKHSVRLGNTDPFIILFFRDFLENICGVSRAKIKYSLQIFGDITPQVAINYWSDVLKLNPNQIGKPSIIKFQRKGTYKKKNLFGVMQIACHNKKLKAIIDSLLDRLKTRTVADVAQLVERVHGESA